MRDYHSSAHDMKPAEREPKNAVCYALKAAGSLNFLALSARQMSGWCSCVLLQNASLWRFNYDGHTVLRPVLTFVNGSPKRINCASRECCITM